MSTERTLPLLALLALACAKPSADLEDGEDDIDWPEPELCEVRQQEPSGELVGPSDVVATCDADAAIIGTIERSGPVTCTTDPQPIVECPEFAQGECSTDADCVATLGSGARCHAHFPNECGCVMPCASDGDCPPDRACVCRSGVRLGGGGTTTIVTHSGCWPAECRSDEDCGTGTCTLVSARMCGVHPRVRCKPAESSCASDLECGEFEACHGAAGEPWTCVAADPGCGP